MLLRIPIFLFLSLAESTASAVSSAGTFSGLVVSVHLADHCRNDEKEHQTYNKSTHRLFLLFICRQMRHICHLSAAVR